jgi:serine/threonine-protein kinase
MALRGRAGEQPRPEDYRDRFPSADLESPAPASTEPGPALNGAPTAAPRAAHGWEMLEEIGRGGIGVVHRRRNAGLRREEAVKVLREEHRGNADLERRIVEEAQIGGQLQHPGVVPVYELGEFPDRRPYFTMKLVRGQTLADLLGRRKAPGDDLPRLVAIFEQVCQTLAYAHAHRVLHRDLKPANVMVGAFGEVQVMDWGLAKVLDGGGGEDAGPTAAEKPTVIETVRRDAPGAESRQGSVMGTFAYMPPEQARGEVGRLDERCDVFGLGAILCKILTGEPPYTGTDEEVSRKAKAGDLRDAFARLAGCGAAADLVGLARSCLSAEPEGRPRDAGAVATAVTAYLAGVQERLRVTELERAAAQAREAEAKATAAAERRARAEAQAREEEAKAKAKAERRARRVTVGLAASVLVTAALLGGGGGWLWWRQAETTVAVEADLGAATAAAERGDDRAAREALERAEGRMAAGGFDELRRRVAWLRGELDFAARLEEIRLERSDIRKAEIEIDWKAADAAYAKAFSNHGFDPERLKAPEAGDRIGTSPVRARLAAALDDWAMVKLSAGAEGLTWVLEAVRRADRDERWALLRDEAVLGNASRLKELAARSEVADWSPAYAGMLAAALKRAGEPEAAVAILREVQRRHPGDFWVNEELALHLYYSRPSQPGEAVGFARAATAVRPGTARAHLNLGCNLDELGRREEAEKEYREALRLNPASPTAHYNLGLLLAHQGKPAEAEREYREALRLMPDLPDAHCNLGLLLADQGKPAEAEREYREAIRLKPDHPEPHLNLGTLLYRQGNREEAEKEFREALRLNPHDAEAHNNLGNRLDEQGRAAEAEQEYREALRIKPDDSRARYNLGSLLHQKGKAAEAEWEYREAIRIEPDFPEAHFNLGNLLDEQGRAAEAEREYREAIRIKPDLPEAHFNLGILLVKAHGRREEAEKEYREALRIKPKFPKAHCVLGLFLQDQGRFREALDELRHGHELGSRDPRWNYPSAAWVESCRRLVECDALLPSVLNGAADPADAGAALGFARVCQYTPRHAAAARLSARAFDAAPEAADDLRTGLRYNAACSAAQAGCGQGIDAPADEAERARLRAQARAWLRADLAWWAKAAVFGNSKALEAVRGTLHDWQEDAALASVRDADDLAKLPEAEQAEWNKLWADVDAVLQKAGGAK